MACDQGRFVSGFSGGEAMTIGPSYQEISEDQPVDSLPHSGLGRRFALDLRVRSGSTIDRAQIAGPETPVSRVWAHLAPQGPLDRPGSAILSVVVRFLGLRIGWMKLAIGAGAVLASFALGWSLRGMHIRKVETQTQAPIPTTGSALAMNSTWNRQEVGSPSGCFENENLRRSWFMDDSRVQWIDDERRYEEGRFIDGQREGCWSFWYRDGLFDSGSSGTYQKNSKIESAPSPLGDFGGYD